MALKLTALNAFVTDTWRGINGLVSMRWVFLGAVDVPAHAKSGITAKQTGALRSDGRPSPRLAAEDGDKWRRLPAKCTHIFNSIILSQHGNSHCQSGLLNHANRSQSGNISQQISLTVFFLSILCKRCTSFYICIIRLNPISFLASPSNG